MNAFRIAAGFFFLLVGGLVVYFLSVYGFAPRAPSPEDLRPVPIEHPFGIVAGETTSQLTLRAEGGKTLVVRLTPDTQVLSGTSTRSISDISIGAIVSVSASSQNADGSLTARVLELLPPPARPLAE